METSYKCRYIRILCWNVNCCPPIPLRSSREDVPKSVGGFFSRSKDSSEMVKMDKVARLIIIIIIIRKIELLQLEIDVLLSFFFFVEGGSTTFP